MVTITDKADVYTQLLRVADSVRKYSYSPYSNYRVGAAVFCESPSGGDPRIYAGTNVENASYGLTICAERAAFVKAVADGCRDFKILAIVTDTPSGDATSCGACRQFMSEFNPDLEIITGFGNGEVVGKWILHDLLPYAFGPERLGKVQA